MPEKKLKLKPLKFFSIYLLINAKRLTPSTTISPFLSISKSSP
jgi:hypothetical protein